eukprot:TRINITY_DN20444_c0_g1_i1.p1 TRINITY_DN20444_c0_g1~~TRINITY_DN20444_c0_g1_i1.p1  ORF type:complete len:300 (+),score=77.15 TRINITY_DN20444_c0_g1_i1:122-1021(+)
MSLLEKISPQPPSSPPTLISKLFQKPEQSKMEKSKMEKSKNKKSKPEKSRTEKSNNENSMKNSKTEKSKNEYSESEQSSEFSTEKSHRKTKKFTKICDLPSPISEGIPTTTPNDLISTPIQDLPSTSETKKENRRSLIFILKTPDNKKTKNHEDNKISEDNSVDSVLFSEKDSKFHLPKSIKKNERSSVGGNSHEASGSHVERIKAQEEEMSCAEEISCGGKSSEDEISLNVDGRSGTCAEGKKHRKESCPDNEKPEKKSRGDHFPKSPRKLEDKFPFGRFLKSKDKTKTETPQEKGKN